MRQKFRVAVKVFNEGGPKAFAHKVRRYFSKRVFGWRRILLSVSRADVLRADWSKGTESSFVKPTTKSLEIHWVIPPAGVGSGGHLNIFRFVRYLEKQGHSCQIYYYDPQTHHSQSSVDNIMREFPHMKAKVWANMGGAADCDVIFATSWQTAYPVFNLDTRAKKFYFVQDYEPFFYPVSTESVLAENTYRFGFTGITAGKWLTEKLQKDFGMQCDYYDFGSDSSRYHFSNKERRKQIFFYARPVTPRRGFELGTMALEIFNERHPEYEIHFAGWDTGEYKLPYKFVNHGVKKLSELDELYNNCAAALVISLTNMSLLPLELLSAGCIPVVNDAPNNRLVSNNPYISYAQPSPKALADALCEIVERDNQVEYARKASASVEKLSWDDAGAKVERILEKELYG
jgi:glycosyltransferase involved in cell wall biosynthesis